jgi:Zn-dependent peptidase ImmA (M78 family)
VKPQSRKGREYERIAMMIRRFAGARRDRPINPFELAKHVKLRVVELDQIKGLSDETRRQLLKSDRGSWSAGTTKVLPNGWRLVILNPTHGKERIAATLMEEICHIWLGHRPGKLHYMEESGLRSRDYNESDETAAYSVGAAVLLPYSVLRMAVENGIPVEEIAKRYGVSRDLVEFRIKVTHLWDIYKQTKLEMNRVEKKEAQKV